MMKTTERNESYRFSMTEAERAALEALARHEGLTMAAVIRQAIRQAAQRAGLWPSQDAQHES
jgi:predicted DNA-binding protein